MWIAIISGTTGIAVAYSGIRIYHGDVSVLAGAEVTVAVLQCALYVWLLHRRGYANMNLPVLLPSISRYLLGSLFAATAAWATLYAVDLSYRFLPYLSTSRILGLLIQGALAALVGLLAYLVYSYLRCKEELKWLRVIR